MNNYVNDNKDSCGYSIEEWRIKLWNIELHLAMYLDKICRENGLQLFLIGGGAIGSVRHKGFIPWDDDLDFGMKRNDFDRLIVLLNDKYKNENIVVQYGTHGSFCSFLLRIRDTKSKGIVLSEEKYEKECQGVFIEVYPFDKVPNSRLLRKKQLFFSLLYSRILDAKMNKEKKGISFTILRKFYSRKTSDQIWEKLQKNSKKYNQRNVKYFDTPSLCHYYKQGIHHFKCKWIENTIYVPFEKTYLPICNGNHECLTLQYGDYMCLPKKEERGKIHDQVIRYEL